jgi:hypothetical protein
LPWHRDFDIDEGYVERYGTPLRFSCHISKPQVGHVFATEVKCFHMEEQGNTYQWDDWKRFHGGANIGFEPKYLLNFIGRKNDNQ